MRSRFWTVLMAISLATVTALLVAGMALAYPGQRLWVARWNGTANGDDVGYGLAITPRGSVYVGGTATNASAGKDIEVIKYDSAGSLKWWRHYNGTASLDDEGGAIAVDRHGNVCMVGKSESSTGNWDYVAAKWDPNGHRLWVRRYDGPAHGVDEGRVLAIDRYGNVYVSGLSEGVGTGFDYATIKYTPSGQRLWVRRYDNPAHGGGAASGIVLDSKRNVYVTGDHDGWGTSGDYLTVKYTTHGVKKWARRYDGYTHDADIAYNIDRDAQDNIYVAGFNYVVGVRDIVVVKYGPGGVKKWARRYDDPNHGDDSLGSLHVAGRHVYVAGNMWNGSDKDFVLRNYSTSGAKLWTRTYDSTAHSTDYGTDVTSDEHGNVFVTGTSENSAGNNDWLTIKYDAAGHKKWARRFDGPGGGDDGSWVVGHRDDFLYVAGYATGASTSQFDITTIRYGP